MSGLLNWYTLPYSTYRDDPLSFSRRGWEDITTPASPRLDPFIYGGRNPARTNENLTDEKIADAIKTKDIAISPGRPNFENTAPRIEAGGEEGDALRRLGTFGRQTATGLGFGGSDISLSGTNWELTPEQMLELRARDEAKRAAAAAAPQYGPLGPRPPPGPSNDPLMLLLRYLGVRR
jgi:hypothetical protein